MIHSKETASFELIANIANDLASRISIKDAHEIFQFIDAKTPRAQVLLAFWGSLVIGSLIRPWPLPLFVDFKSSVDIFIPNRDEMYILTKREETDTNYKFTLFPASNGGTKFVWYSLDKRVCSQVIAEELLR